ncbi:MAG: peptide ABC transporter [Firmicutes bacterium]|nr:peptide ABC transporter [Bacillota bacterium]
MKKIGLLLLAVIFAVSSMAFAAEGPVQGGTFRYGITTNPRGMFNPILNTEVYDRYIVDQVFDGLIEIDRNLIPQPCVAKSWEISEDSRSITFYLHEGITFHDGAPLTARDVEYTYKTILHPHYTGVRYGDFRVLVGAEAYKNGESDEVPGIEVIDDYTIRFNTEKPHAPLLTSFGYGIMPAHLLADIPVGELETADFNSHPIGSGPFVFQEFKTDQHVILTANDNYFRGRPNIDTLVFQKIATDAVPIWIQQGRVDFVEIAPEQYPEVDAIDFVDLYVYEALSYNYIAFNLRQERMADVRVRQAMTYGFDRDTYVEVIREGFAIKANAPMPQASWAFTDEGINSYDYNPELARKMLAEAGWKPGRDGILQKDGMRLELELLVPEGSRANEQMALLFQQNMADLGIKINLVFMEFNAAVDRVDAREFDMFTMGWSLSVDPDPYGIWHSSSVWNDPGFFNERSDELIEMGREETDPEKRKEIYAEWQRVINYELPDIFLSYGVVIGAIHERVQGIDENPGPLGPLEGGLLLRSLWLSPEGK